VRDVQDIILSFVIEKIYPTVVLLEL